MSVIDARLLEAGSRLDADVCIVGAGAAGLTLAAELDRAGAEVCLIESGGDAPDPDTQALYDLEVRGYPVREDFMSRARYYGGSCNLWAGRSMRFDPADFEPRPWVPGSGWPIPYVEVAKYYPAAARALGLPHIGLFDAARHEAELTAEERSIYEDRSLAPAVSLWARRTRRFGAAHRSRLKRSHNVRLVLFGNVTSIRMDDAGARVEGVDVATLSGRRFDVRARAVVLACGGLENARLLLASRDRHADGIGNARGLVGRYFMDHPRAVYGRVHLRDGVRLSLLDGMPLEDGKLQLGIGLSREVQCRDGLLDHYATFEVEHSEYTARQYQSFVRTMKVLLRRGYAGSRWKLGRARLGDISGLLYLLTPRELMPHALYRLYWRARRAAAGARSGGGRRVVVYFCEQPPDPDSRVTLSRDRDALGVPRLVLDWRLSQRVGDTVRQLQARLGARLARTGVGVLEEGEGEIRFTDASHHMGTTRMSTSPGGGVVDTDGRVHGVHGLYVAGSSVFPSASHKNPTLTIVALALRLADHLRQAEARR